tara:strand:+ start:327 stop:437 length:111 start_codon:yes stop_codon:yes gene_type:complete
VVEQVIQVLKAKQVIQELKEPQVKRVMPVLKEQQET